MTRVQYTLPLSRVNMKHVDKVGGKSASLGELLRAGIPVPDGFTTTVDAYFKYLADNDIAERIYEALAGVDISDDKALDEASRFIRILLMNTPLPIGLSKAIKRELAKLGVNARYAVRSSANAEDGDDASFAGQQETFLNVSGVDDVMIKVHDCLASLFHPRSILYRVNNGIPHEKVGLAVTVQLMAQSEVSGVMFTENPVGDSNEIAIGAIYGLGEYLVGGNTAADNYIVRKKSAKVVSREKADQEEMLVLDPTGSQNNVSIPVPAKLRSRYKLTVKQIEELAEIGKLIEKHYGKAMDIEWGYADGKFVMLQARPVTVKDTAVDPPLTEEEPAKVLVTGALASKGVATGRVVILDGPEDCHMVQKGDILVAAMTSPDYSSAFERAAAVVTQGGNVLCHAAIVCRENSLPCIVAAPNVLSILKTSDIVTVDASHGQVFDGVAKTRLAWNFVRLQALEDLEAEMADVKTDTKVMAILANPLEAIKIGRKNVDGIGLVRMEELLAKISIHPQWFVDEGVEENYINHLVLALSIFCESFGGRDVIVRTLDFKQNEMRGLKFGDKYEPDKEENPMLGWRGARRYIGSPEVFAMEVEAIKRVRELYPNLHVMIPFVRTVEEMAWCAKFLADHGLVRGEDGFKLWMMVEVPSNVFMLEKFLEHVDGVSIGSNDLFQLGLGVDRDNPRFAGIYDETDEAILYAIELIVRTARKLGKTAGLCGQAATNHESIVELLVDCGATSLSVSPDTVGIARRIVARMEQEATA